MNPQIKILLVFFANTQIQIELIDALYGTKMFNQAHLHALKQMQNRNEMLIKSLYNKLDQESEFVTYKMIDSVQVFLEAIKKGTIEDLILILDAFSKGEINIQNND